MYNSWVNSTKRSNILEEDSNIDRNLQEKLV